MEDKVTSCKYIDWWPTMCQKFILQDILGGRSAYSHFIDEDTEAQKICLPAQVHTATRWQSQDFNCYPFMPFLHTR